MINVTAGGVLIGLGVLLWHGIEWFPGLDKLKKHPAAFAGDWLPFLLGAAYGILGILTTMGLIGWAFDTALWASNWLGDAAIWVGVGDAPGQTAAGAPLQLSRFANWAMVLLTFVVVAIVKFRPSGPAVKRGVWCGLCLGTSATVGGALAGPLALGLNWVGEMTIGAMA
jgi:hypothetical protein